MRRLLSHDDPVGAEKGDSSNDGVSYVLCDGHGGVFIVPQTPPTWKSLPKTQPKRKTFRPIVLSKKPM
jgi:hypothetical protein